MIAPSRLAIVIGLGKPHPGPPPPFDGSANNRHKASSEQQGPKIKRDAFIYLDPQEPKEEFAQCSSCVVGQTLVFADGRARPIAEVAEAKNTFLRGQWSPISAWRSNGTQETIKVTTSYGQTVCVTGDHRIYTDRGWVEAVDLRPHNGHGEGGDEVASCFEMQMSKADAIDRGAALLLGALTGDGWRHSFTFRPSGRQITALGFCYGEHMREAWQPLLKLAGDHFESAEKPRKVPARSSQVCDRIVASKASTYRISWRTDAAARYAKLLDKRNIPAEIWQSTPDCMGFYLRGLFSTDGTISSALDPRSNSRTINVRFDQTTERFIDQMRLLLLTLGIHSTKSVQIRNPRYKDLFSATISRKQSLERFAEIVGFVDQRRSKLLYDGLQDKKERPWRPERIRSVQPDATREVFDISVPDGDAFYANGLLVHNCMMYTGATCTILGPKIKIPNGSRASCNFYVHGDPVPDQKGHEMASVTPQEAGLVNRAVRCENCASFDGENICLLYRDLNKKMPEQFDLDESVDPYGCCNAQTPKDSEEQIESSETAEQETGEDEEQPIPKRRRTYRAGVET